MVKEKHLKPNELKEIKEIDGESEDSEDSDEAPKKRQRTGESTYKKMLLKKDENVYINVIDIKRGKNIAKICPYNLDVLSNQKVCLTKKP